MSERIFLLSLCFWSFLLFTPAAPAAAELPDRVVVFKSREADLLKPKFIVGRMAAAQDLFSDTKSFWGSLDQKKIIAKIKEQKEEPGISVEVRHIAIESHKLQRIENQVHVSSQFIEKTSGPLKTNEEVIKALEKIPTDAEARVIFVVLFFERTKK